MFLPPWSAVGNPKHWSYEYVSHFELLGSWMKLQIPSSPLPQSLSLVLVEIAKNAFFVGREDKKGRQKVGR